MRKNNSEKKSWTFLKKNNNIINIQSESNRQKLFHATCNWKSLKQRIIKKKWVMPPMSKCRKRCADDRCTQTNPNHQSVISNKKGRMFGARQVIRWNRPHLFVCSWPFRQNKNKMPLPTEDIVLYSIIAFIVIENFIEIYLARRQVSNPFIVNWIEIEQRKTLRDMHEIGNVINVHNETVSILMSQICNSIMQYRKNSCVSSNRMRWQI